LCKKLENWRWPKILETEIKTRKITTTSTTKDGRAEFPDYLNKIKNMEG